MDAKQKLDLLIKTGIAQDIKNSQVQEQPMPQVESGSWQKNQKKFSGEVKKLSTQAKKGTL